MKKFLIAVSVLAALFVLCIVYKQSKDAFTENVIQVDKPVEEESVSENDIEEERYNPGVYIFSVPTGSSRDIEVDLDGVEEEDIILYSVDEVECLLLHNVSTATLLREYLQTGLAVYQWTQNNTMYPVRLTCVVNSASDYENMYTNLLNTEWCTENGYVLLDSAEVQTAVGNGNAFMYKQGENTPKFVTYIQLKNGYVCALEIEGEFLFVDAMEVTEDILTNGITVILSSAEEEVSDEVK